MSTPVRESVTQYRHANGREAVVVVYRHADLGGEPLWFYESTCANGDPLPVRGGGGGDDHDACLARALRWAALDLAH